MKYVIKIIKCIYMYTYVSMNFSLDQKVYFYMDRSKRNHLNHLWFTIASSGLIWHYLSSFRERVALKT